ncbi:MAG: ABC transporter permease [Planctomyces sp.]
MKRILIRFLTDYGMLVVLTGLCGFFSIVTWSEQFPTGTAAARQIADLIQSSPNRLAAPAKTNVLIVARNQPVDLTFAAELKSLLQAEQIQTMGVVNGEPRDARTLLQKTNTAGTPVHFIAMTQDAASWLVFRDLSTDFPALGQPQLLSPISYGWPNFLKSENLINIANQIAVIAIIAIGMTMVIVSGGIDLSVGSLIAFSAVVSARWIRDFAGAESAGVTGMIIASVVAVSACAAVGLFSGLMITLFGIPPFIVTLAMMLVASGTAYILADGQSVYQIPESFVWLGRGTGFGGIPHSVTLMIILYGAAHILMSRMKPGRYLYAVGGNREAARLSGVPVTQVLLFAYLSSAVLAGLGGVIMASQLKSGSPTYGNMYELYVIAAAVVGGTSLSGGEGRMPGTLLGAFTIAVIQNGMNLTKVESYTQKVVLGLVILGAVMLDLFRHRS